ncbi:iron-siderophore ABC transporter permease [Ignicoccus pacificus DSM 13166]|uniref:Iron-siderophore ABC transporter permease n=1 Tax=Ignicoccus pacificus DSM 13166 TaxID=940294 RepID=A0A977KA56_9CREN|nr:iron-siderophore ABC transporter permease [Ignicoccus pacificus DSM 13166]
MPRAREIYNKIIRRRRFFTIIALLSLIPLVALDLCTGGTPCWALRGETGKLILYDIRLPVALAAILAGASLALAGSLAQTILNNPLASPYTLGISAGAAFGAALAYVFNWSVFGVASNAFLFATLTASAVFMLSKVKGLSPEAMVLAGIAMNYLFHSLLAFAEFVATEEALQAVVFWTFGSLYKATWFKLSVLTLTLIPSSIVALLLSWKLSALRAGEEVAEEVTDPGMLRIISFVILTLVTAVTVCFFGIIAFVGLVAPHVARILVGEDQRFALVTSMATGASLLLAADVASKNIIPGAIIPIGIVTSFVGVPFFVALLIKGWEGA